MSKQLFLIALATIGTLASCSKADPVTPTPTPTPTPPSSAASTPSYATGDGAIVALITRTTTNTPIGAVDFDLGTGVAVFGSLSSTTYNDAGKVTLNGKELTKQSNNAYVYTPSAADVTGIDLDGAINWSVTTPSFTYNAGSGTGRGMPNATAIAGTYTTVDANAAFTLELSGGVSNADSVYFQINGPSKSILKRMSGSTTSVTYTADEVKSLGKSVGCSVTIAPWNHQQKTLGGKIIHVINELAISRTIEIK